MQSNAATPPPAKWGWTFYSIIAAVGCLLYIVNAYYTPLSLFPIAGHDDGHFLLQGEQIARGHWLGGYTQMTLIKGPGLPLFLVLGKISHLPYSVFLALFQALSFVLVSVVIGRFAGSPRLALVLLVVLLTFPWIWSYPNTRILREGFYTPQILVFLSLGFVALWSDVRHPGMIALLAGLALGSLSITREETPWLYPVIGVLILISSFLTLRLHRPMRTLVIGVVCIAAGFGAVRVTVSTGNYIKYKGFLVTDISENNFRRALAALFAAGAAEQIDHIPVPRASRKAIYEVSPTFAQLRPLLDVENAPLSGWQQAGCGYYGGLACGDYAYPWVMWTLRDAVAVAGYYQNARTAAHFYRAVALEIEAACRAGKLTCRYSVLAEMPPPVPGSFGRALEAVGRALKVTAMLGERTPDRMDSLGPSDEVAFAQAFLNDPLVEPARLRTQDPAATPLPEGRRLYTVRLAQTTLKEFYRIVWPAVCVAFVLFLPLATLLAIRRRQVDYVLIIAWIFTAVAASRIVLLSFMAGYLYDAVQFEYLTPAPYALLVAVVACSYSLVALRRRQQPYGAAVATA